MDKIKMTLAVALVIAGLFGYYYFSETAQVLRVLMVLGGLLAAAGRVFHIVERRRRRIHCHRYPEGLAGQEGIEPPTPGFGDRCSAN